MQGYIIPSDVTELVLMTLTIVTEKWLCGGALGINIQIDRYRYMMHRYRILERIDHKLKMISM